MTDPTWETLVKSGVDSETIEEAIERIVQEHDDDPVAHMEDGQSIDEHRKETTIDHPVGSVLADKTTISEYVFQTFFESLSGMTTSGSVSASSWPGVTLEVEDGGTETSYLGMNLLGLLGGSVVNKDFLFETQFIRDTVDTTFNLYFGVDSNASSAPNDVGFRVVGGYLRGFATFDSSYSETGNLVAVGTSPILLRVQYIASEKTLYFYVNGVEEDTLVISSTFSVGNQFYMRAEANGEESGVFRFYSFRFAISQ